MAKKSKISKKTKKYQPGGLLSTQWGAKAPGATGFSAAGSIGSSLVDAIDPADEYGVQSTGGAVASGALKGAGMGAALGPVGALVGGAVGGITSLLGNKKAKAAKAEAEEKKKNLDFAKALQESNSILANYNNSGTGITSFEMGGNKNVLFSYPAVWVENPLKFKPTKNTFQAGGSIPAVNGDLKPISDSAFEVEGDDPGLTDDVGLGDAYVDHDEVIKPTTEGIRIFSDSLKPPGSKKPFSKLAKSLEKQKSNNKSNATQDELVEHKLNNLFQLQQLMNGNNNGESVEEAKTIKAEKPGAGYSHGNMFQTGGYSGISGSGIADPEEFYNLQNASKKKQKSSTTMYNLKPSFSHGGTSPVSKYYHPITPEAAGLNPGNYFGSKVMAGMHKGGTIGERVFEFGNYKKELAAEPGHGPKSATFKSGGIHIKPSKKGTFTAAAKKHNMGVQAFASKVLSNKGNYSSAMVKKANFAKNASKWKHQQGGTLQSLGTTVDPTNPLLASANPRAYINEQLIKNYPGIDLAVLDQHNKPVMPGVADTPAMNALRHGYLPSGEVSTPIAKPMIGNSLLPTGTKTTKVPVEVKYQTGGFNPYKLTESELMSGVAAEDKLLGSQIGTNVKFTKQRTPRSKNESNAGNPLDWNNILTTAGTLAPTFANMAAARRLPKPPMVHLNKTVNLKTPDFSDQDVALKQGLRTGLLAAKQNSVMGQAQTAAAGNVTGNYFDAVNKFHGDANRLKTDVNNKQALINTEINARNNALLDQYSQAETARASNMLGLQSQNRADLSNKILGLVGQDNQKKLDKQRAKMLEDFLNKIAPGVADRNPEVTKAYIEASNNKKGGLLNFKLGGKMKKKFRYC